MAKKTHHHRSASRSIIRAPKPIILKQTRTIIKKAGRKLTRKGSGMGGLLSKDRITTVGAGFAVGMLEKMDFVKNLPHLPFLGTTGTIGVAAFLLSDNGRNRMADDIATAALTVAGYMLGSAGSIVGGDYVAGGEVAGW